jgi:triphosphoribosyl-dephospho-CoA synthase
MSSGPHLPLLFKQACLAEIEALKPGNVHIFADGHGMTVQDFVRSAEVASTAIARQGAPVGKRILDAVHATWDAVGCNTNLGILLLGAPLLKAAEAAGEGTLTSALDDVLAGLTIEDAELAFKAIARASPAGLGQSTQGDVHEAASMSLLEAMRIAQDRDRIAKQYVTGYADVFEAARLYEEKQQAWQRPAWAVTAVYLHFLSSFEDSHILRKHGMEIAEAVRDEAKRHFETFVALENPKTYMQPLLDFDASLKSRGLNPGTSADLTVATILCSSLCSSLLDS